MSGAAMIRFARFTDLDWMGYGGAESFADGQPPLISSGEVRIDGEPADIIIDATGVSLWWTVDLTPCSALAEGSHGTLLLAMLRPAMTYADLAALPGVRIEWF